MRWRSAEGRHAIQQEVTPGSLGELSSASEEALVSEEASVSEQVSASIVVMSQSLQQLKVLKKLAMNLIC